MVKPFEEAAFNSNKNQIVGPIESDLGYHVIYVRDTRKNDNNEKEVLASHILIRQRCLHQPFQILKKSNSF